jgi:acetylornithine deacetylase
VTPARGAIVDLLRELVAIESVNSTLVAGGSGEAELAAFVASWLERAGLDVEVHEAAPGRPNVVAVARGRHGGRSLLLNAHLDTVGLGRMMDPLAGRVADGRMYGRGAYDMKASLAAIMLVGAAAAEAGLAGDVIVAAVVDEEAESVGTAALAGRVRASAAVVAEPTELEVCIAHKGFVWLEVETRGVAAHGSRYEEGVDAIARMGRLLGRLEEHDRSLRSDGSPHPLLGGGSVHASLIEGGSELSTYPASCLLTLERRTLPGESAAQVEAELRALLPEDAAIRTTFVREPLETREDEPVVEALCRSAERVLGRAPAIVGVPFWTDAALLASAGVPTVVFGPAGAGAHADVEWVDLESVEQCQAILLGTARDLCGAREPV